MATKPSYGYHASMYTLSTSLLLELPVSEVFPFFADAANLERITPKQLSFKMLNMDTPHIAEGSRINYRLSLFGVPFGWTTRISVWEPSYRFVDEQLKGPYHTWIHEHKFESTPQGTLMTDTVQYALPLAPLGNIAHPLIKAQLNQIFGYRQQQVQALLTPKVAKKPSIIQFA